MADEIPAGSRRPHRHGRTVRDHGSSAHHPCGVDGWNRCGRFVPNSPHCGDRSVSGRQESRDVYPVQRLYLRVPSQSQVQTIMTQVASAGVRMYGESVFRQQLEPLPFRQVARRDDLEVPAVKGSDLVQVESLGERYYTGIHDLESQR